MSGWPGCPAPPGRQSARFFLLPGLGAVVGSSSEGSCGFFPCFSSQGTMLAQSSQVWLGLSALTFISRSLWWGTPALLQHRLLPWGPREIGGRGSWPSFGKPGPPGSPEGLHYAPRTHHFPQIPETAVGDTYIPCTWDIVPASLSCSRSVPETSGGQYCRLSH